MKHGIRDLLTPLAMLALAGAAATITWRLGPTVSSACGDWAPLVLIAVFCLSHGLLSLGYLRVLTWVFPLRPGVYGMDDLACFVWKHQAVIRDLAENVLRPFFPLFLKGLYYSILGGRLGRELGIGGKLDDAPFITLRDHVMIGHNAYVTAHAIVYDKLVLEPVTIGRGATIGVNAVVMPGVDVGEQAVVAPGSVVKRGTKIPAGEFWGGVPARKIGEVMSVERRMRSEAGGKDLAWGHQP